MAPVKKTAAKTTKADSASVKETAAALAAEDAKKAEDTKAAPAKKPAAAAKKTTAAAKKTTTAAKKAPAKKATATRAKKEIKHTSIVEFGGNQYDVADILARAEAAFKDANKRKRYDEFRVYIKPEENKAFYVVKSGDKESTGSVDL